MKILVTGGAGFIGIHIVKLLLAEGHIVTVYDNSSENLSRLTDTADLTKVEGDLKDQNLLEKSLEGVEAVIHMASLIEVGESVKFPLKFAENNILGSVYLLEAMKNKGVKKIIFSSSATVYGIPKSLPLTEDMPLDSANPYAASKISVEQFLSSYHKLDNFDVTILRYFNPYGPGELHNPESHAIPNFIKSGLKKEPIPLYWKGEQVRDFIYVEDLAKAHIVVLNLTGFNVFNVGTEAGVKIIDVVNYLSDILGYTLEIKDLGDRPGDVAQSYASSKKLQEQTGWKTEVELKEGLQKTVDWFKENS